MGSYTFYKTKRNNRIHLNPADLILRYSFFLNLLKKLTLPRPSHASHGTDPKP